MPEILIVIPAYNEASRFRAASFDQLQSQIGAFLLFVNDGSTDGTEKILRAFCSANPLTRDVLNIDKNRGKAEAVRRGLLQGLAHHPSIIGYLDADLSTPIEEAARLICVLQHAGPQAIGVLGSRVKLLGTRIDRNPLRHYFGRVFATAAALTLGIAIYDTQCGAKFFRSVPALQQALVEPFHSRWIFDVELIGRLLHYTASTGAQKNSALTEVALNEWRDVPGSRLGFSSYLKAAQELLRIRYHLRRLGSRSHA
jgi:dolichyl-phosphate beta-glucosyltransferase